MSREDLKRTVLRGVFKGASEQSLIPSVTVGAVMTRHPVTVTTKCSAYELVQLIQEKQFRHVLVTDGERLVGVVSDRDVIRLLGNSPTLESDYLKKATVRELMSTDLITVSPSTYLAQAVSRMVDVGINCLPVVDGLATVGILTSTDVFLCLEQLLLWCQQPMK